MTKTRLNILFVHEVDLLHKVVYDIHIIMAQLSARGHRVYAIDCADPNPKAFLEMLKTRSIPMSRVNGSAVVDLLRPPVIGLPILNRLSSIVSDYVLIQKVIEEKRIDLIVVYSAPTNGIQTIRLARDAGIPVAFKAIDFLPELVRFPLLKEFTGLTEGMMYRNADCVLASTPRIKQEAIAQGADPKRVFISPNGVDPEVFCPQAKDTGLMSELGIEPSDRVAIFVGSLFSFCGVAGVVKEFEVLVSRAPKAKLLVVGDGPDRPRIERLVKRNGLSGRVLLTGFRQFQEIPRYINLAEVCILPFDLNPTTEGIFPIKIVQYLSCNKPVLSTVLPGVRDFLQPETSGVIYAEPERFASVLGDLLSDEDRAKKLGMKGRECVSRNFTWTQIVDNLEIKLISLLKAGT